MRDGTRDRWPARDRASVAPTAVDRLRGAGVHVDDWGERVWHGDGFEAPMSPGRIVADDPATFQASLRWVQLDHVRVEMLTAEPHRYEVTEREVAALDSPAMMTLAVGEGDIRLVTDRGEQTVGRGDVVLTDETISGRYHARRPVRLLWSMVGLEHIPAHLADAGDRPVVLPRTRLVNSYVAFLSALMTGRAMGPRGDVSDPYLLRALVDLQISVLAERRLAGRTRLGEPDLRGRIGEFVLEHLAEPDLGPARIADALGISLRYAHQVFNRDGETLAQYVRDRRLESVASALRDPAGTERLSELATRFGFASRDQLTRAFRRRYGVTMGEYRERESVSG